MAYEKHKKTCVDCGTTFMGHGKSKRCPECQARYTKFRMTLRYTQPKPVKANDLNKVDVYFKCGHRDCRYCIKVGGLVMCDYLMINLREHPELKNHGRPCPATPDCTCFEKKKRGRKPKR